MSAELCPLCGNSETRVFYASKKRTFYTCDHCFGIYVSKADKLSPEKELQRYLLHNNDMYNEGYRNFVSPIIHCIVERHRPDEKGLDFGAGPGPVVSEMLRELNFDIQLYDPFFHDDKEVLGKRYNYIVCCEVIEHFYNPYKEFQLLKELLEVGGNLYCMTNVYEEKLNFESWYYKEDPTHVFFYQYGTLQWIKDNIGFANVEVDNRLIIFQK